MKKILLFLVIITFVCGCGTKTIDPNISEEEDYIKEHTTKINCSALEKAEYRANIYETAKVLFLTSDGELYKIGKYTDGTNCMKISGDIKGTKLIADNRVYLVGTDKKMYEIIDDNELKIVSYSSEFINIINNKSILKIVFDWGDNIAYYLKDDGKIYTAEVGTKGNYTLKKEKEYVSIENEKILDFEMTEYMYWIKTDKGFYVKKEKDERCKEYDDIKCEYEYSKLEYIGDNAAFIYQCSDWSDYTCNYILKDGTKFHEHWSED